MFEKGVGEQRLGIMHRIPPWDRNNADSESRSVVDRPALVCTVAKGGLKAQTEQTQKTKRQEIENHHCSEV